MELEMKSAQFLGPVSLIPPQFPTAYCDEQLPAEQASALRELAAHIKLRGAQQTEATLAIGRELIAAKERLSDDQFRAWIGKEFGMAEQTANSYIAVAEDATADPVRYRQMLPKLVRWNPDPAKLRGASGYADVELPWGVMLHDCPVFAGTRKGPYIEPSFPSHVGWPKQFYGDEFNDAIIAQIDEVDPLALNEHRRALRDRLAASGMSEEALKKAFS